MTFVPCDHIDVTRRRDEPEGALERMMSSLKLHKQLHPVIVAPSPTVGGRYVMLAGRRRLAAAQRLGWKHIEARIVTGSQIQQEMVEISENFDRLDLTTAERDIAVGRYAELLRQFEAEKAAHAAAPLAPRTTPVSRFDINRERRPAEPRVIQAVAQELSIAPRTAQRILRRSDALSEDERRMLDLRGVRDSRLDRIVAIKDPEQRANVVTSIGEGVTYIDAMAGTLGSEFVRSEDDMIDADWLATLKLSSAAVNRERFRKDALFYRAIQRGKIALAEELKWPQLKTQFDTQGICYRRALFFLECPHPREWILCGGCKAGVRDGKEHLACRGGGYLLS